MAIKSLEAWEKVKEEINSMPNIIYRIRHYEDKGGACYCDIDNHYIGYIECMEGWCRHWAKERGDTDGKDADNG